MFEISKINLSRIWLVISSFALVLPIFMPSSSNPQNFHENVIGTVTVMMFILSFPASLFGLLILFFAGFALNVNLNSMEGMYLNLFLLFALGFVQWFWILPRIAQSQPDLQTLNLPNVKIETRVTEAKFAGFSRKRFCKNGKCEAETRITKKFQVSAFLSLVFIFGFKIEKFVFDCD
jgi:Zn-dependent protease with chaperone function